MHPEFRKSKNLTKLSIVASVKAEILTCIPKSWQINDSPPSKALLGPSLRVTGKCGYNFNQDRQTFELFCLHFIEIPLKICLEFFGIHLINLLLKLIVQRKIRIIEYLMECHCLLGLLILKCSLTNRGNLLCKSSLYDQSPEI